MAQVSLRLLHPRVKKKLETLLIDCVARCQGQDTTIEFLDDLLTDTEKMMLAKRIAIALMLLKGKNYEEIDSVLKVTKGTIWRVKMWLDRKGTGFRKMLSETIKQDEGKGRKRKELLEHAIEDNPIWKGPGNWSLYKKDQWKQVKETPEEPF